MVKIGHTCVVLSRVKTMKGLFMTEKLTKNLSKHAMKKEMKDMLKKFKDDKSMPDIDDEDYQALVKKERTYYEHLEQRVVSDSDDDSSGGNIDTATYSFV